MIKKLVVFLSVTAVALGTFLLLKNDSEVTESSPHRLEELEEAAPRSVTDRYTSTEESSEGRNDRIPEEDPAVLADAAEADVVEEDAYPGREEVARLIAVEMEKAEGSVFNFSSRRVGDPGEFERILEEAGLEWPQVWDNLDDYIAFNNLRMREEQAILRLRNDPEGAVVFFETQLGIERDRHDTRRLREPWDESRRDGGPGDISSFETLVSEVPDLHFSRLITENFSSLVTSPAHINAAVRASWQRDEESRMPVFARLADEGLLESAPQGREALEELSEFVTGAYDESWTGRVELALEAREMAEREDFEDY